MLGARVTEYLVDHYGQMDDGVNRGDESDRLMVAWALAAPASAPREADVVTAVEIPHDIEALLQDGFVVIGFDDDRGYLFGRG